MLTIVLVINGLIGLVCLVAAWQLWKLKRQLAHAADTLDSVEQTLYKVLHPAPKGILTGQSGTHQLRQNLNRVELQLQRLQKVMALLSFGQFVWKRRFLNQPFKSSRRRNRNR